MKIRHLVAGALAVAVGGMALVGWAADVVVLKSLLPGWVSMKPNTALAFLLMGSAMLLSSPQAPSPSPRKPSAVFYLSQACALLAGLIGLLTLCEYALGWNPGFDQWLFKEPAGAVGTSNPGRMAPDTAVSFLLLAAARLAEGWHAMRRARVFSVIVGSLVTTLALVEIFSYFTPVLRTYGWGGLTMMALPTATLFAVLGLAIIQASWREALSPRLAEFSNYLWWLSGSFGALAVSFALYVRAENQVDRSNTLRLQSMLMADELRQSTDDLTRMARTYVMTGDAAYKRHFRDILAIREGEKPRPEHYQRPYWDLVLGDGPAPRGDGQAVPLLESMRKTGFTREEFRLLLEAKANSDKTATLESEAMALAESSGPGADADRAKARRMLYDARYHEAKAATMVPILDFLNLVDKRTLAHVQAAENTATIFRYLLAAFGFGLAFVLWRTYRALGDILGGAVDEVYRQIATLGAGDFSKDIPVRAGLENSVLGWLSETQTKLKGSEQERQQAEAALRASEERFRMAAETANDVVYEWDLKQNVEWFGNIDALLGYDPGEFPRTLDGWTSSLHPQDLGRTMAAIQARLEGCSPYIVEYRVRRKDGSYRWWSARGAAARNAEGVPIRWIGSVTDITERKLAEAEILAFNKDLEHRVQERTAKLNDLNAYNRSLLEASLDSLVTIGLDGRIQDVNEATVKATGASRAELVGSDFSDYFTDPDKAKAGYEAVFRDGFVRDYPLALRHRVGETRQVLYNASVYRNKEGQVAGVFAAARDVTDMKRIEGELREALELNQKIISASPLGMFACRADGPCVFANEAIARISGASLETMQSLNFHDLASWHENGLMEKVNGVLSTGADAGETVRLVTTFGREIWMKYQITRFIRDNFPHFLMVSEDVTAQKKAEEAIQAFSAYNRSLLEASLDPLVTIAADGRIQDVNDATVRATGVSREGLIGSDFTSYFTEPGKARAGYEKVFEEGMVRDYELSIKHRDGGVMAVLYNASLYRNKDGQIGGIFAAARDITERRQAERAMARTTAILDEAGRLARIGGWEIDLGTRELTWTETTYAIHEIGTDYKPTVEEGFRFYAPESAPIISEAVRSAMEDGTPFDEELEFITAKQNRIWVRAIGKGYRENGRIARVGGVFQDITARKRSEAIKTIQSDLVQLLGGHTDLMGAYSAFLDAAIEISGLDCGGIYAVDEAAECLELLIAKDLPEDFIKSSSPFERPSLDASLVLAGRPAYVTLPAPPGSGEAGPGHLKALAVVPLRASQTVLGCLSAGSFTLPSVPETTREALETLASRAAPVIARIKADMANLALNRELSVKTVQLEAANKELEAFSYSVSHDLRAPLRHMTGFVELLGKREMDGLDEKSRHYLKVVSDSAQKMGCLIDDLLSFSRMGRAEMMKQSVDLKRLAQEAIEELSRDLPAERAIQWRVGDLPVVTGDRAMLRQVFANLFSNAVKYSRHVETALIEVDARTSQDNNGWTVSVRDNGAGFDMKYVDKLFGLFQRLHAIEEYEGTGVGLANVRRIVARHGGRTWAEGELGRGAAIYFTLPCDKEAGT